MLSRLFVGFGMLGIVFWAEPARAQHYHAHGNHYNYHQNVPHGHDRAGHLTDSYGHHINGDGVHTGRIGVYENGSYSNSGHYGGFSNYYHQPSYVYPSVMAAPIALAPSIVYSTPSVTASSQTIQSSPVITSSIPTLSESTTIVANKIPTSADSIGQTRSILGGTVKLINPRITEGQLAYKLNKYAYTIRPGESQTVQLDREWVLRFDNGLGKEIVYRLSEGKYEFSVSEESGWTIGQRIEDDKPAPPIADEPSIQANRIPDRSLSPTNSLPSTAIESPAQ